MYMGVKNEQGCCELSYAIMCDVGVCANYILKSLLKNLAAARELSLLLLKACEFDPNFNLFFKWEKAKCVN